MSYALLGIEIAMLHIIFSFVFVNKTNKMFLFLAFIPVVLACVHGKVGILIMLISVVSIVVVYITFKIPLGEKVKKQPFLLIGIIIIGCVGFSIYLNMFQKNVFLSDVLNSYMKSLYNANRFSAIPVMDLCIMHFLYLVFIVYFCSIRRKIDGSCLFWSMALASVLYIVAIGFMYAYKWANDNITQNGEYMTGFGNYMRVIAWIYYVYAAYSVIMMFLKKRKESDK